MKILFIGGTGNISAASSRLALQKGYELYLLNRGNIESPNLENAISIKCDINNKAEVKSALKGLKFDVVANFIAFKPEEIKRDIELFTGICKQYIFISSASAYQKPLSHPIVTESTPLANPYWDYSRDKIACEDLLNQAYREKGFPITIVRPSLTYDTVIPVSIGSWTDFTIIDRMRKGKKVIIHGDGSSLWTITHSDDFAKGFVGLLGHQQAIGQSFHITSDEILTWNQIYEAVAEAAGVELNAVHIASDFICREAEKMGQGWMWGNLLGDKAASVVFDNSKIKTFVPEFKATIPFSQGFKRTVEWFDADESRKIINEENNVLLDSIIAAYEKQV
ncbi:MAG: SDR family oxidoreductase [Bacteroidales bacterium]|nr:SDR family oxidoreductase [Bacteroidales bacterium]MCF8391377.1 SDR family oxidoreductase [Bacteroidales bacterium]